MDIHRNICKLQRYSLSYFSILSLQIFLIHSTCSFTEFLFSLCIPNTKQPNSSGKTEFLNNKVMFFFSVFFFNYYLFVCFLFVYSQKRILLVSSHLIVMLINYLVFPPHKARTTITDLFHVSQLNTI